MRLKAWYSYNQQAILQQLWKLALPLSLLQVFGGDHLITNFVISVGIALLLCSELVMQQAWNKVGAIVIFYSLSKTVFPFLVHMAPFGVSTYIYNYMILIYTFIQMVIINIIAQKPQVSKLALAATIIFLYTSQSPVIHYYPPGLPISIAYLIMYIFTFFFSYLFLGAYYLVENWLLYPEREQPLTGRYKSFFWAVMVISGLFQAIRIYYNSFSRFQLLSPDMIIPLVSLAIILLVVSHNRNN